jgi:hypothetical protein
MATLACRRFDTKSTPWPAWAWTASGLKGGHVLAPVEPVSPQRAEWLVGKLEELGFA